MGASSRSGSHLAAWRGSGGGEARPLSQRRHRPARQPARGGPPSGQEVPAVVSGAAKGCRWR
eukprot:3443441-Alexandrium_andersonii.AAC.1